MEHGIRKLEKRITYALCIRAFIKKEIILKSQIHALSILYPEKTRLKSKTTYFTKYKICKVVQKVLDFTFYVNSVCIINLVSI